MHRAVRQNGQYQKQVAQVVHYGRIFLYHLRQKRSEYVKEMISDRKEQPVG
jgi:hypothetical protein